MSDGKRKEKKKRKEKERDLKFPFRIYFNEVFFFPLFTSIHSLHFIDFFN